MHFLTIWHASETKNHPFSNASFFSIYLKKRFGQSMKGLAKPLICFSILDKIIFLIKENKIERLKSLRRGFFPFIKMIDRGWQFLIKSMFHSVPCGKSIDRLPPSVLLISSNWELVCLFSLRLMFHMKMPVPFRLLIVSILIF